ncbi:hypothetical protein [Novosphingobium sp.]|uniref:hypothetical protein n=1 Tax=Novosphingobium sp. TaxID=1874826 RepID=UPI003B51B548
MELGRNDFGAFDASDVEAALRPLGWSELCARLVAAQDYRRGLSAPVAGKADARAIGAAIASGAHDLPAHDQIGPTGATGSFHTGTARMLEHFEIGNRAINSNSSTSGKVNQGTPVDSRQTTLSAFAERQADENSHD